jgi:hypothetical protein
MQPLNRRHRTLLVILLCLTALYAVFGFFLVPRLLKSRLVESVVQYTHRPFRLGEIATNPFTLSLTLHDFDLQDPDSSRFLGFREFYINFELSSIFHRAITFSEVRLTDPYVNVRILRDGRLSFQDLVTGPGSNDTVSEQGTSFPILIQHLILERGDLAFEDHSRFPTFITRLDSLSLSLVDFTTRPDESGLYEFSASTPKGEYLHWRGDVSSSPIHSRGSLELKGIRATTLSDYLAQQANFRLSDGSMDFKADYETGLFGKSTDFRMQNGVLGVKGLRLEDKKDSSQVLTLGRFSLEGLSVDYGPKQVRIALIRGEDMNLNAVMTRDTAINLQRVFRPVLTESDSLSSKAKPAPGAKGWDVLVARIEMKRGRVEYKDHTTDPVAILEFTPIEASIQDLRYGTKGQAKLNGSVGVNGAGMVSFAGTLNPDPIALTLTELQATRVGLAPFQPYVNSVAMVTVKSGSLSFRGTSLLTYDNARMQAELKGNGAIDSLRVTDNLMKEDLIRWGRLEVKQLSYRYDPQLLSINEIVARRSFIRFVIGPDRISNLQAVMGGYSVEDSTAPAVRDSAALARRDSMILARRDSMAHAGRDTALARKEGKPPPGEKPRSIRIGQVTIVEGVMDFADQSLTPPFATGIYRLNGTVKGLSSDEIARADVDVKGEVDQDAPVTIAGQINPLSGQAYTDIKFKFQNIELTSFSPYSGKFMGYKIDRGKLNLDLQYKLNSRYLIGENKIVIDQLTLGQPVEGPDVTSLPVKLAIALLKDSRGVIDLDIPVEGSLDDPEFSIFPIILKVLLNLLIKIVTAPFALIGALFGGGGGDDLSYVRFEPGLDSLARGETAKIDNIAKGLNERPGLLLDVRGIAVDSLDRPALARRSVMARISASENAAGAGALGAAEQDRLLRLYRDSLKADPEQLVPQKDKEGKDVPEGERREAILAAALEKLVAAARVSDDDMRGLARKRAEAVRSYLISRALIDPARVFVLDPDPHAPATAGEIRLPLALNAR